MATSLFECNLIPSSLEVQCGSLLGRQLLPKTDVLRPALSRRPQCFLTARSDKFRCSDVERELTFTVHVHRRKQTGENLFSRAKSSDRQNLRDRFKFQRASYGRDVQQKQYCLTKRYLG